VDVPDVTGRREDAARRTLEDAGLKVDVTEQETEDREAGTVLEQDPAAGTEVDEGSTVTLTVAKAPPRVEVPDVLDKTEAEARAALEDAGFTVRRVREDVQTADEDGVVIDQDPPAGEERRKGTRVTIFVGRFAPDPIPGPEPSPEPTPDAGAGQ
jgi:serine/threonine-protein kinase